MNQWLTGKELASYKTVAKKFQKEVEKSNGDVQHCCAITKQGTQCSQLVANNLISANPKERYCVAYCEDHITKFLHSRILSTWKRMFWRFEKQKLLRPRAWLSSVVFLLGGLFALLSFRIDSTGSVLRLRIGSKADGPLFSLDQKYFEPTTTDMRSPVPQYFDEFVHQFPPEFQRLLRYGKKTFPTFGFDLLATFFFFKFKFVSSLFAILLVFLFFFRFV